MVLTVQAGDASANEGGPGDAMRVEIAFDLKPSVADFVRATADVQGRSVSDYLHALLPRLVAEEKARHPVASWTVDSVPGQAGSGPR
jgi:hypothetical protein